MMIFPRLATEIHPLQETSYAEFSEKTDPTPPKALASESEKQGGCRAKASREHPHSDDSGVVGVESVPTEGKAKPRIDLSKEAQDQNWYYWTQHCIFTSLIDKH